jgi:dimethylamine/trimethylamine dehydrogenase
VTPNPLVSEWTYATLELPMIESRLMEAGVEIVANHKVTAIAEGAVELTCAFTEKTRRHQAAAVVMVTTRLPNDALYNDLMADPAALKATNIRSVTRIGDCLVPALIAAAVQDGHRYAQELDEPAPGDVPFRVEDIRHEPPLYPV